MCIVATTSAAVWCGRTKLLILRKVVVLGLCDLLRCSGRENLEGGYRELDSSAHQMTPFHSQRSSSMSCWAAEELLCPVLPCCCRRCLGRCFLTSCSPSLKITVREEELADLGMNNLGYLCYQFQFNSSPPIYFD